MIMYLYCFVVNNLLKILPPNWIYQDIIIGLLETNIENGKVDSK